MEKCYKFRIYPTASQEELIKQTFGCVRYVYNHYLALRKEAYDNDKRIINYNACSANLTNLKKELKWLCNVDSKALQSSLKNLDYAFQNFFRGLKSKNRFGYPKFKTKHNHHQSYSSKNTGRTIWIDSNYVRMPKVGLIKSTISQKIEGRILFATISQVPSGKYFLSICCTDVNVKPLEPTGRVVGIDLGIKDRFVTSDGCRYLNQKYIENSQKKLSRLQRELSRKPKGSKNHEKARIRVAKVYEKVTNQRRDTQNKLTTQLIREYDIICVESLMPTNMVKNHRLARSILDVSWGEFMRQLEYKSAWYGKIVSKVGMFFPSSQTCCVCGKKNPITKNLDVRTWTCTECATEHDRDVNAAKNILAEGLRVLRT